MSAIIAKSAGGVKGGANVIRQENSGSDHSAFSYFSEKLKMKFAAIARTK
jgi:hypothetical protein